MLAKPTMLGTQLHKTTANSQAYRRVLLSRRSQVRALPGALPLLRLLIVEPYAVF